MELKTARNIAIVLLIAAAVFLLPGGGQAATTFGAILRPQSLAYRSSIRCDRLIGGTAAAGGGHATLPASLSRLPLDPLGWRRFADAAAPQAPRILDVDGDGDI